MNAFRDKYAIVGTGKSRLGQVGLNSLALLEEAIKNALDDAGLTNKDVDGVVVRGPDDVYSHHQLVAARLGIDVRLQHQPRQWRRQPDPGNHSRCHGDRSWSGDHGGLRLRPRQLDAHSLRGSRPCAERSHSRRAAAAGAWPGVRPFRRGLPARLRRPAPHVRIRHDARRISRRSPPRFASMRCAIPRP